MLKPAVLYKDALLKKYEERLYSDEYFWMSGDGACNVLPTMEPRNGLYQWAIVDDKDNLIGYLSYQIEFTIDTVSHFEVYTFDEENPLVAKDSFEKMGELVRDHRRIEWGIVDNDRLKIHYDQLCEKYNGNCVRLHQKARDVHGAYHDAYIYEIISRLSR